MKNPFNNSFNLNSWYSLIAGSLRIYLKERLTKKTYVGVHSLDQTHDITWMQDTSKEIR